MPRKAPTHNPHPGRKKADRPSPSARGYDGYWRKLRLAVLMRNPICQAEGCNAPATEVDHIIRHVPGEAHDERNLMSLCKSHHSAKTVARDHGFGRPPRG